MRVAGSIPTGCSIDFDMSTYDNVHVIMAMFHLVDTTGIETDPPLGIHLARIELATFSV